ncbi:AAA family ATPase [Polyangium spumosum]|uniref:AAA family ATPase n=1 Tax=Polyangium spumosum TaxID=889282 RepID=UPI0019814FF7
MALYGANASGKTNVVGAMGFMREVVITSQRLWEPEGGTPQEPFALSDKATESSLFEVDFLLDGKRHRYGFVLDSAAIEEEWLYTFLDGEARVAFERKGETFEFGDQLADENNEVIASLTRGNSLFLSAAAQNNHRLLRPLYGWFGSMWFEFHQGATPSIPARAQLLRRIFGAERQLSLFSDIESELDVRERQRESIRRLLQSADIGIKDIKIEKQKLLFMHRAEDPAREVWLPLSAQSAGTVALLNIAVPLLDVLAGGGLLCIDELEASLHPKLALELLRLFNDPKHNPHGAQLVFTTHDTNLLGNTLGEPPLRRDQIWFTEKDQAGATHLYPLTDFHPKQQENIERGYLQGRYGAIPFLGDLLAKGD